MNPRTHPNIYVIGTGSTGKTTLVTALRNYYASNKDDAGVSERIVIAEVAREVIRKLDIDRDAMVDSARKCLELQTAILRAQYEAEMALSTVHASYISDRSGLDPIAYTKLLVGEEVANQLLQSAEWRRLEENIKKGLVLLCEAGCSWLEDDGLRLMPKDEEDWHRFDHVFRSLLDERDIAYHVVSREMTSIDERVKVVIHLVDGWRRRALS